MKITLGVVKEKVKINPLCDAIISHNDIFIDIKKGVETEIPVQFLKHMEVEGVIKKEEEKSKKKKLKTGEDYDSI